MDFNLGFTEWGRDVPGPAEAGYEEFVFFMFYFIQLMVYTLEFDIKMSAHNGVYIRDNPKRLNAVANCILCREIVL